MALLPILPTWSGVKKVVIGMLHLPALPGSPRYAGHDMDTIIERVFRDAEALADGGVHGLMMENFGDVPFYPGRVPAHVVAHMTAIAGAVREQFPEQPLGINVLRNDGQGALAIAAAVGAAFIRVNVLCGVRVADQGLIHGIAHELMRDRAALGAQHVKVLADVDVKHSAPLAAREIEEEVEDTLGRGLADGLIVSGSATGKRTDVSHVKRARAAAARGVAPVFVGSGVSAETIGQYLGEADGFIIGTAFKKGGEVGNPVELERVERVMGMVT